MNATERIARFDWHEVARALDTDGYARLPRLLSAAECRELSGLYVREDRFRKHIDLERHRFGRGEYRYFAYPLPALVARLRARLYPRLVEIANRWQETLRLDRRFPSTLPRFLSDCRAEGQARPTPLLLRYQSGGYNRLHQDIYGAVAFPLQVTCLLSRLERDFTGGEFLLVEQRPRMQSRGEAIRLELGEAIVFPTRERPVEGKRGSLRAQTRHARTIYRTRSRPTWEISRRSNAILAAREQGLSDLASARY